MEQFEHIVFPCQKVRRYLEIKGYKPSSALIDGCQRFDKDEREPIFLNCVSGITLSVALYIVKTAGDDFITFSNLMTELDG